MQWICRPHDQNPAHSRATSWRSSRRSRTWVRSPSTPRSTTTISSASTTNRSVSDYRLKFPFVWISEQVAKSYRPLLPGLLKKIPRSALELLLKQFQDDRVLVLEGKEITLRGKPRKAFSARSSSFKQTDQPTWEITHQPSGVDLREYDDFSPWRVAVWGAAHVVSAEVFIDLNVAAGKTQTWTRKYEFGN